jgi:hypothetical protein
VPIMKPNARLIWSLFLLFPAILGIISIVETLQLPSDPKNSLLLGISAGRLLLLLILLAGSAGLGAAAARMWFAPAPSQLWIETQLGKRPVFISLCAAAALLLAAAYTLLAIPARYLGEYTATLERARPLLSWMALLSLQLLLGLAGWRAIRVAHQGSNGGMPYAKILRIGAVLLAAFLGLWIFIGTTKMGVWPGNAFWGKAAVPVLWPQILLALLVSLGVELALMHRLAVPRAQLRFDLAICVLLWLAATLAWSTQSYSPGSFNTPPHPPNFQIYPSSDAQNYDTLAAGEVLGATINTTYAIDKPIYIAFLALLHLIAGSNYSTLYLLQIAVFAFIPIVGYFLGKTIHSRQLGLMFAILLVLREQNAIALINVIQVSTSKMILSEPLTALGVLLFTLFLARWLKKPEPTNPQLWIAGGILGLTGLVRLNALTIVPFALLAIGIALKFKLRPWLGASLLLLSFLLISIVPWSIESYRLTRDPLAFVSGKTAGVIVGNRYAPLIGQPAETPAVTVTPALTPTQPASTPTIAVTARPAGTARPTQPPGAVAVSPPVPGKWQVYTVLAENIGQHYLHNLISMVVMLPPTGELYQLHDLAVLTPYWTLHWDGGLEPAGYLIVFLVLGFVALGIAAAWARTGASGIVPLLVVLGYNISTGLALTSGGRYVMPIDWAVLLFFSVGVVEISTWLVGLPQRTAGPNATPARAEPAKSRRLWPVLVVTVALFVLIGSLPIALDILPPARYPPVTKNAFRKLTRGLPEFSTKAGKTPLAALLTDPHSRVTHGSAFYPRFYPANMDEVGAPTSSNNLQDFNRVSFFLIGSPSVYVFVIYPTEFSPDRIDTDSEVWVLGCPREGYFEARVILLSDGKTTRVLETNPLRSSCE